MGTVFFFFFLVEQKDISSSWKVEKEVQPVTQSTSSGIFLEEVGQEGQWKATTILAATAGPEAVRSIYHLSPLPFIADFPHTVSTCSGQLAWWSDPDFRSEESKPLGAWMLLDCCYNSWPMTVIIGHGNTKTWHSEYPVSIDMLLPGHIV